MNLHITRRHALQRTVLCPLAALAPAPVLGAPLAAAPASRDRPRLALVIGNAHYVKSPLKYAKADAQLMAQTLRDLRFDVVEQENLARQPFHQALDEFVARVTGQAGGGLALLYYAGHGVQLDGLNYLIPVDRALQSMADVRDYGVPVARLVRQLGEANAEGVNIVVLDACRTNPFVRSRAPATGSAGLAPVTSPRGTLVAYSTDPDRPALDGGGRNGRNSIYTETLAESMKQPGVPIEAVFKRVRAVVTEETQGRQTPWENTSLRGELFLVPR